MKVQKSLEINFHGPISFHICKDVVWAYLPKCRDHVCNVLTDMNDISPKRRMVFELVGPTPASTKNGGNTLLVQRNWNSKWGPKPQKCYCVFKLPSPDLIFGLRAEYVKIEIPGEKTLEDSYARGLRFFYRNCSIAPKILPPDGAAAGDFSSFDATYYGHDDLYQLEIRFHDTKYEPSIDHHHKDAMACSLSMRKLFPPCHLWKVNYERPKGKFTDAHILVGGKHPVDCGANLLVFTDDGIQL